MRPPSSDENSILRSANSEVAAGPRLRIAPAAVRRIPSGAGERTPPHSLLPLALLRPPHMLYAPAHLGERLRDALPSWRSQGWIAHAAVRKNGSLPTSYRLADCGHARGERARAPAAPRPRVLRTRPTSTPTASENPTQEPTAIKRMSSRDTEQTTWPQQCPGGDSAVRPGRVRGRGDRVWEAGRE